MFLLLLLLFLTSSSTNAANTNTTTTTNTKTCPPFGTSKDIPYPFSTTPGYGHPNFQIKCQTPFSTIQINNMSFSLLNFLPLSSTLLLSPLEPTRNESNTTTTTPCFSPSFPTIPSHPINLSLPPFRLPEPYCSRLASLRQCTTPPSLPPCPLCPFQCTLVVHPLRLLHNCPASSDPRDQRQGCQSDVLEYIDKLLRIGIQVQFDDTQDSYFSQCRDCKFRNGFCGFNNSDPQKPFLCYYSSSLSSSRIMVRENDGGRSSSNFPPQIMVIIISSVTVVLVILAVVITTLAGSRYLRLLFNLQNGEEDPTVVFLRRHRSDLDLPPVFSYEELESATQKFDLGRKIGDGGFGSVYLGRFGDGRVMAVKCLHRNHSMDGLSTKSFYNEILVLSLVDHPNLVKIRGYCSDPRGLVLVHDYVPNGSLSDHLHGGKSLRELLTWQVRLNIALQTALALEYLHFEVQPPIVHRDITSSNIFVERDMRVRVGDFGLSRPLVLSSCDNATTKSVGCVWTGPQGTPGYLDPDYHKSFRLTEKSDVYSFGVVLLELLTGLRAVDQRRGGREVALADLVVLRIQTGRLQEVIDPALLSSKSVEEAVWEGVSLTAELAFRCVAEDKDDRPDSREVVEELRRIHALTRTHS